MSRRLGWAFAAMLGFAAAGCSNVPAMAPLDEGDVVMSGVGPADVSNLARFEAFLDVTASGGEDAVRIVQLTEDGSPIHIDIKYAQRLYTIYHGESEAGEAEVDDRKKEKAAECAELRRLDRPDEFREYACGEYKFLVGESK